MAETKDLFTRLKKMFSTDVIVRNIGGKRLKIVDTDVVQYATDKNSLRDRFNRLRSSTYNLHNRDMSLSYQSARLELFRDYDVMDMDPILSSALDIYADECLSEETIIPLLDGRKVSIGELYRNKETDFWVYSVDSDGKFSPQLCERVAHNGKKSMVKVTLCDGTEVRCTQNHIWILDNGEQIETSKLVSGSKLKAFSTKLSDNKFLAGYEMLKENGKWEYTHRMVANRQPRLAEQKKGVLSETKVVHHTSFDKRNNSPEKLNWMGWSEHYKLHADYNRDIWSDPTKALEYKKKIKSAHAAYWTPELKASVANRQEEFMLSFVGSMTESERKKLFGVRGEKNGMFGNGHKLSKEKNGRWKNFSQSVDIEEYENDVIEGMSDVKLRSKYNISRPLQDTVEASLRDKWGVDQIKQISAKKRHSDYLASGLSVEKIKLVSSDLIASGVNIYRKYSSVSSKLGITVDELKDFISTCQYNSLQDIVSSSNHRVVSIESEGILDAYDLVNVGTSHVYAIEAKDGSKVFTHNCLVPSEFGKVITIRSNNEDIKRILENLFYDILNIEFNLWSWVRNMPVKYNSPIPLLSGEIITIEEVSKRHKEGQDMWVYSVQDGTHRTVPGKVVWCDKNYTSNKIVKITLDDGSNLETAPEHPFILRNGDTKRADELMENDALMPFYRKLSPKKGGMSEYEMLYNPETNDFDYTHRLVARSCGVETNKENRILHHSNFNKYDNTPSNLTPMEFFAHRKLHADHCKEILHSPGVTKKRLLGIDKYLRSDSRRKRLSEEMSGLPVLGFTNYNNSELHSTHNSIRSKNKREMWKDPTRAEKARSKMKIKWSKKMLDIYDNTKNGTTIDESTDILRNNAEFMSEWSQLNNRRFKRIPKKDMSSFVVSNHRVSRVEIIDETADVYCMTVIGPNGEDDRHNFSMCGRDASGNVTPNSGVFVKNCKYGDFFLRLQISPEYGVYTVQPISAYELTRIEGSDPKNINYVKYQHDGLGGGCEYENFEIAHFRLISDSNFLPYGKSMLEGARRVWKQLSLMEDAMLIHRIMRAPEKRIFKLDVGNLPPGEIDSFMEKIMNKMKKVPYLDERTGDYNLRFNLNNMVEDFYLPVRGGDSGTSIDTLPGMEFTGTEDIEYIRNKMMAALKIPKAFLGYEEGISGKATLAAEDVRFSRTIGRLQRIIVSELTKIAIIHLYVQGFKDATLVDFELELSNPSTIFEQEKIDMFQNKVNLAKDMLDAKLFSKAWVYHNIFSLSKVDVENLEETILKDQKTAWRISQIEEEGNDPATSNQGIDKEGVPQDLPGGDTGGGDAGGGPEAGGGAEGLPELPALQESPSEEEVIKEAPTDEELGIGEAKKRDQTGNKEKYSTNRVKNRGEDVLGDMAAHEKPTSNPLRHTFRGGSPLAIDEELKFIKKTLAARFPDNKKSVITEERSLLDESNIIEDDKAL